MHGFCLGQSAPMGQGRENFSHKNRAISDVQQLQQDKQKTVSDFIEHVPLLWM